jgi:hypothetical protein
MPRAWLPQLRKQLFGGKNRSLPVTRAPRPVRLTVERLEDRTVPSFVHGPMLGPHGPPVVHGPMLGPHSPVPTGTVTITGASLVNANDQPLTGVTAGEQFYVQATFTTQGLPSYASYRIIYTVNGQTMETGPLTWGAGSSGTGYWIAYWGAWTATSANVPDVVTVTSSYYDNSKTFAFAPLPAPTSPQPTRPPAISYISAPYLENNGTQSQSTWWLQNTGPYTISVEYEVQNYRNGVAYGPVYPIQMTLGPESSHPTVGGGKTTIGGDVYTSQVFVLSAAYV